MTSLQAAWDRAPARERGSEIEVEECGGPPVAGPDAVVVLAANALSAHDRWAAAGSAYALRRPARPEAAGAADRAPGPELARASDGRRPLSWRAAPPGGDARRTQALRDGYMPPSGGR